MNLQERRFLKDIGLRVKEARIRRGLTQADLGRLCELDRTFIGSVERGERNTSILNLKKIASALRTDLSQLIG